jgi:hypothetical protein
MTVEVDDEDLHPCRVADEGWAEQKRSRAKRQPNGLDLDPPWDADPALPAKEHIRGIPVDHFFAYMPMHNYIHVPTRTTWPASSVNARVSQIKVQKANGETISVPASAWLDSNRPIEQMTWVPGGPMVIRDQVILEGGWIVHPGCACFNLYRPPNVTRGTSRNATTWIDHVKLIYPEGADHILDWLAHRVQRPDEKINHALVLGGEPGIGKDTLLEPVKHAVGPWNFQEASPAQVLGRFNGFLKAVILRISEARDLGEFDRFQFYDHMKRTPPRPPISCGSTKNSSANIRSPTSVACSSPQTTRPTASICRPRIAAITWLGPTAPKKTPSFRAATGTDCGRYTAMAGSPTWLRA